MTRGSIQEYTEAVRERYLSQYYVNQEDTE